MVKTERLDLYARHKDEYVTPKEPVILTVKPAAYLAIVGKGAPEGDAFPAAIGALYSVAFTLKMARKHAGRDYAVSKLEALWWATGRRDLSDAPRDLWHWQLMIRVPDFIRAREVTETAAALRAKGKPADVSRVELVPLAEGRVVQALHVGPYQSEPATIAHMHALAKAQGFTPHGRHHEIYLSDPGRVAPARLRTILRQPIQ